MMQPFLPVVDAPRSSRFVLSLLVLAGLATAACGGYGGKSNSLVVPGSIGTLNTIKAVASTVDAVNGDQNPYGLVVVPAGAATSGRLAVGDLLISNFNNRANVQGQGTTVERVRPSDANPLPVTFFAGAAAPVALVLNANATSVWIANYGLADNGSGGNVQVTNNKGALFTYGNINDNRLWGSWGQGFNGQTVGATPPPVFFDANVLTGAVYRLQGFPSTSSGPNFAAATITQIATLGHLGTGAAGVVGPQGMAYVAATDTLYVSDPANNRIVGIPGASTASGTGPGVSLYAGSPLKQPAGLAINPLTGNLLVVDQGDNFLHEINLTTQVLVASKLLDATPVVNGAGAALFGLAAIMDANNHLVVYFVNDNTNTINALVQ